MKKGTVCILTEDSEEITYLPSSADYVCGFKDAKNAVLSTLKEVDLESVRLDHTDRLRITAETKCMVTNCDKCEADFYTVADAQLKKIFAQLPEKEE